MALSVVILAAGQGTRMYSRSPKVLHPIGPQPMLAHVVGAARVLGADEIYVVYGHGGDAVPTQLAGLDVTWVEQDEQLGTGHALAQVLPRVPDSERILVLYGDVPLIEPATLQRLLDTAPRGLGILTVTLSDPSGYGRVVRDEAGAVARLVEHKDANPQERALHETNTGILTAGAGPLKHWVAQLSNDNSQGEYYLTDVVAMAVAEGVAVSTAEPGDVNEVLGINDRAQLAEVERRFQRRQAHRLMKEGLGLKDPDRFDLRGTLTVGRDVVVDVNVVIEGRVHLADGAYVGPNSVIRDTEVGEAAHILEHCVVEGASIGRGARVGPFSRVRPETALGEAVHVGNFVEIKKSGVGEGSKINHLSYIGDTTIGTGVNIGAGTITCNYDGANKHRTVIGDNAFIGSDTQLVAPVTVGAGATIGAGSTITRDAPDGELTLSRAKQETRRGWKRPQKKSGGENG